MDIILQNMGLIITLLLLVCTYFIGSWLERRHFASIRVREKQYRAMPVTTFDAIPSGWVIEKSGLVEGNMVVSVDYFKRFLAALRMLVGGNMKSYEPLLDRARREALLRMIEEAKKQGFNAVVNVRLETARLANNSSRNQRLAGVEMLAYGTGIRHQQ